MSRFLERQLSLLPLNWYSDLSTKAESTWHTVAKHIVAHL